MLLLVEFVAWGAGLPHGRGGDLPTLTAARSAARICAAAVVCS
jgi:hypothetical protein